MMQRRTQQAGFSLLELVVALAISALVALMGASAMSMALDFYQRNAQRSTARESIRAAERILRHEWAGRGLLIRSDGLALEFITLHPVLRKPQADLVLARVRYACEPSGKGKLELSHSVASLPGDSPGAPQPPRWLETRILASDLQECAFSFLTEVRDPGGAMQPRWQAEWDDQRPAPHLMRLALSDHDHMPPVVYPSRAGSAVR
ncbi:MAG: prepilin-type N-terminal cleavage/methylation domain-containing protein [Aquabacterium sp.]|nr:MAG: prepilin-type N-terminal cleavage/methylation domain-containing protein [Aquabacterium sp.]